MRVSIRVVLAVPAAALLILMSSAHGADRDVAADWDVEALRLEGESQGASFEVGDSWVTKYLANGGQITAITGLDRPADWQATATFVDPLATLDPAEVRIPSDFDWRKWFTEGLQPIKNQGSCGSCWAFAITAMLESLHYLKNGASDLDLAEQTLVSSCEQGGSCGGGYFSALDYVQKKGLPFEADDPYLGRNSSCKQGLTPRAKVTTWAYIGDGRREPTVEQIKAAIYQYGPVVVDVNASFGAYKSGVYDRCNNGSTNHMVTIEGWDEVGEYWIVRNSWGADWGEAGYLRIKFNDSQGRKCNGIGRVAAFAVIE